MLHPSYSDLMAKVNSNVEEGEAPVVNSRYSIVLATAKRARQLISGASALTESECPKPLSIAVAELNESKIKILNEEEYEQLERELSIRDQKEEENRRETEEKMRQKELIEKQKLDELEAKVKAEAGEDNYGGYGTAEVFEFDQPAEVENFEDQKTIYSEDN
ncbi:MAG: DNA-directed RNA polymerase subunit omega [Lachnospiraceae bacterium]|nr:DNA-directed RNA polymerase subunit omega [Lachnospiraceae bacterium]